MISIENERVKKEYIFKIQKKEKRFSKIYIICFHYVSYNIFFTIR